MSKMFISYRRSVWAFADKLAESLREQLNSTIFIDRDHYDGIDNDIFSDSLVKNINESDVFLLIISETTFSTNRINDPYDWIRCEIREALKCGIKIVLISLDDLLPPVNLPEDIQAISNRQTIKFYPDYFVAAVDILVGFLIKIDVTTRKSNYKTPIIEIDASYDLHYIQTHLSPVDRDAIQRLKRLKTPPYFTRLSKETSKKIDKLLIVLIESFSDQYDVIYQEALSSLQDSYLSFEEKITALSPAINEDRFEFRDEFYNQHFFSLIRPRYDDLREQYRRLSDNSYWDRSKRDLLVEYLQTIENKIHEQDEEWLKTYRRHLTACIANFRTLNQSEEKSLLNKIDQTIQVSVSVSSITQDQTLLNLSREIPRLMSALKAGVTRVVTDDEQTVMVDEALRFAHATYLKTCIEYAKKRLEQATGLPIERYQIVKAKTPFSQELPIDELHRQVGKAWIVLDPQNRQDDLRVNGYLNAIYEEEGGSQESPQLTQPNIKKLSGENEKEWQSIDAIVVDLFEQIDTLRKNITRIRDGAMGYTDAIYYLDKVYQDYYQGVSLHPDIHDLWEKVQARVIREFETKLTKWDNMNRENLPWEEIKELFQLLINHPILETTYPSALTTYEKFDHLEERIKDFLAIDFHYNKLRYDFEQRLYVFNSFCKAGKWNIAKYYYEIIRAEVDAKCSYLSHYDIEKAKIDLQFFLDYYKNST